MNRFPNSRAAFAACVLFLFGAASPDVPAGLSSGGEASASTPIGSKFKLSDLTAICVDVHTPPRFAGWGEVRRSYSFSESFSLFLGPAKRPAGAASPVSKLLVRSPADAPDASKACWQDPASLHATLDYRQLPDGRPFAVDVTVRQASVVITRSAIRDLDQEVKRGILIRFAYQDNLEGAIINDIKQRSDEVVRLIADHSEISQ